MAPPYEPRDDEHDDPPATSSSTAPPPRRSGHERSVNRRAWTQRVLHIGGYTIRNYAAERHDQTPDATSAQADEGGSGPTMRALLSQESRRRRRYDSLEDEQGPHRSREGEGQQRNKRRRLHSPPPPNRKTPIRYGYHGQVETGRLRLDLVSCDGGEQEERRHAGISLASNNILKYDKSVYCSQENYVTFVLQHADDTPFALDKLHIISPEDGFAAPVREGVVYVAMDLADLQRYIPREGHALARPDFTTFLGDRVQAHRINLTAALRDAAGVSARWDTVRPEWMQRNPYDYVTGAQPSDAPHDRSPSPSPPIESPLEHDSNSRAISVSFDDDPGQEDPSPPELLDFRARLARRSGFNASGPASGSRRWVRPEQSQAQLAYTWSTPRPDLASSTWNSWDRDLDATNSRNAGPYAEPIPDRYTEPEDLPFARIKGPDIFPHDDKVTKAAFSIEAGKYKVAIHFDPPVSGRFLLLKVWSAKGPECSLELQSVVAEGWAGGRFFKAQEFR